MPFLVAPEMASWASPSWLALVLAGALAGAGAPLHEDTWEESLSDTATRDIILTLWALFGPMGGGALVTFNNLQLTNINRITSAGSEAVLDPDAVVSALMGIHDAVMYTSKSLFMFYAVAWVIGAAARSRSQG